MKLPNGKKNKTSSVKYRQRGGFALLFSVLVSSLLLTIGLSIFSIALKELAISTAVRQSIYAFYAADSGRGCAIYWDRKIGKIPTLYVGRDKNQGEIECANRFIPVIGSGGVQVDGTVDGDPLTGTIETAILSDSDPGFVSATDPGGPNFSVVIDKEWGIDAQGRAKINTKVTSTGRDFSAGDRVERAIVDNY